MSKADDLKVLEELLELQKEQKIRSARRSFFEYCNLKAPFFYNPNWTFLVEPSSSTW